eukprot:793100-Pelagomonas_calceolata.AAC.1
MATWAGGGQREQKPTSAFSVWPGEHDGCVPSMHDPGQDNTCDGRQDQNDQDELDEGHVAVTCRWTAGPK